MHARLPAHPATAAAAAARAPPPAAAPLARRAALAALAAALAPLPAAAAIGVWDGTSSALGSCPVGAAGDGCRSATLARDLNRGLNLGGAKTAATLAPAAQSPVAALGSEYAGATRGLIDAVKAYVSLDPADPSRVPAQKALKASGTGWVSKYAPGGSARTPSARKVGAGEGGAVGSCTPHQP
jgi:hypothetical protein